MNVVRPAVAARYRNCSISLGIFYRRICEAFSTLERRRDWSEGRLGEGSKTEVRGRARDARPRSHQDLDHRAAPWASSDDDATGSRVPEAGDAGLSVAAASAPTHHGRRDGSSLGGADVPRANAEVAEVALVP